MEQTPASRRRFDLVVWIAAPLLSFALLAADAWTDEHLHSAKTSIASVVHGAQQAASIPSRS